MSKQILAIDLDGIIINSLKTNFVKYKLRKSFTKKLVFLLKHLKVSSQLYACEEGQLIFCFYPQLEYPKLFFLL